jgi:ATP-dependent RNA helicase DHX37/DHR1
LVFLTGQNEIVTLCKRLEKRFGRKALAERKRRKETLFSGSRGGWDKPEAEAEVVVESETKGADAEAEDIDLGRRDDDPLDVDDRGGDVEEDAEALDSSDDEAEDGDEASMQEEDSDGMFLSSSFANVPLSDYPFLQFPCTSSRFIRSCPPRSRCVFSKTRPPIVA